MTKGNREIPVSAEPFSTELDCLTDCNGACCYAKTSIWLSRPERKKYVPRMKLKTIVEPLQQGQMLPALPEGEGRMFVPPGRGLYEFTEDCGWLSEDNQCKTYERKPAACNNLEAGTIPCLIIRARAGYEDDMPANIAHIVLNAVADLG